MSHLSDINSVFRKMELGKDPADRLVNDHLAPLFYPKKSLMVHFLQSLRAIPAFNKMVGKMQAVHCIRHGMFDRLVQDLLHEKSIDTIVSLGAGMETRAFRLDPAKELSWIELDLADVIEAKSEVLKSHNLTHPKRSAHTVDLNLAALQSFFAQLEKEKRILVVMEGLIHYFPKDEILSWFHFFSQEDRVRSLLMSYITPDKEKLASPLLKKTLQTIKEVPSTFFTPEELKPHFSSFSSVEFYPLPRQIEILTAGQKRQFGPHQDIMLAKR